MEDLAAWKPRLDARTVQHDHGNQAVCISESVGSTDEKFNLVVCSLYTGVGDAVLGSCYDGTEVPLDL